MNHSTADLSTDTQTIECMLYIFIYNYRSYQIIPVKKSYCYSRNYNNLRARCEPQYRSDRHKKGLKEPFSHDNLMKPLVQSIDSIDIQRSSFGPALLFLVFGLASASFSVWPCLISVTCIQKPLQLYDSPVCS